MNCHQVCCMDNLIAKVTQGDQQTNAQWKSNYTGRQLKDWCEAKISALQAAAAKVAKEKIAAERRFKKLELSDPNHGFKNLMTHLKKTPGTSLSVIARDEGP